MDYRYIALLVVVGLIVLAFCLTRSKSDHLKVKEEIKGLAVDDGCLYVISKKEIGKYLKNGKRVTHKKALKNMSAGKIDDDQLVVADGGRLVWLDKDSLEIEDVVPLEEPKKIVWIDFKWDKCWIGTKKNEIFCYNTNWDLEGYWRLPKKFTKQTGGGWLKDQLVVSQKGDPQMYVLTLPVDKVHTKIKKKIDYDPGETFTIGDKGRVWSKIDNYTVCRPN